MTPGFAKPRSELPWLPYEEQDRVIINAHNFTPLWTPAVNGKMPTSAWVPSRDTAGNGTTTLTDLVGTKNGTLVSMDASDWVADTDAGGSVALEFVAASSQRVTTTLAMSGSVFALSAWVKPASTTIAGICGFGDLDTGPWMRHIASGAVSGFRSTGGTYRERALSLTANVWSHCLVAYSPASGLLRTYKNGSLFASLATTDNVSVGTNFTLGRPGSFGQYFGGRMDDIRVWIGTDLDDADAFDLNAAGRAGLAL